MGSTFLSPSTSFVLQTLLMPSIELMPRLEKSASLYPILWDKEFLYVVALVAKDVFSIFSIFSLYTHTHTLFSKVKYFMKLVIYCFIAYFLQDICISYMDICNFYPNSSCCIYVCVCNIYCT